MTSMPRLLLAGLLACAASAQENPLASRSELDPSLLGTYHFGMYVADGTNIGQLTIELRAEEMRPDATYHATSTTRMEIGPMRSRSDQEDRLAADLSIVASSSTTHEVQQGTERNTETTLELAGETWQWRQVENGAESSATLPHEGPVYDDPTSVLLVAMALPLDGSVEELTLRTHDWKNEDGHGYEDAFVRVGPWTDYEVRGDSVRVRVIVFTDADPDDDDKPLHVAVTEEHRVVAFWPEGTPMRLVAGTAEEVAVDLPGQEREARRLGTPTEAVTVYLRVVAKVESVDRFDDVMDWDALCAAILELDPSAAGLTPSSLRTIVRTNTASNPAPFTEAELEVALGSTKETIDGDTATVVVDGATLRLRKDGEGWLIFALPR